MLLTAALIEGRKIEGIEEKKLEDKEFEKSQTEDTGSILTDFLIRTDNCDIWADIVDRTAARYNNRTLFQLRRIRGDSPR